MKTDGWSEKTIKIVAEVIDDPNYASSEYSMNEPELEQNDLPDGTKMIVPLGCESKQLSHAKRQLDKAYEENLSKHALAMINKRVSCKTPSERQIPNDAPEWAIKRMEQEATEETPCSNNQITLSHRSQDQL